MSFVNRVKGFFSKSNLRETIEKDFERTKDLNKLGILGVPVDKDTEMFLTPHNLMFLAYMIVELHPEIMSSYMQYVNFFVGKGLRSKDPKVDVRLVSNHEINLELKKFVWNYLITGNAYVQKFYDVDASKTTLKASDKLTAFSVIRDSSRVYYNIDAKDDSEYWLYSMHYTGGQAVKNKQTHFQFIKYALQQVSNITEIKYVTKMHKNELIHLRSPFGRNDFYGHSSLMSGWGYARSLKEIIDNLFRISKYQAIGKKIIRVGDEKQPVTNKEMIELQDKFYSEEKHVMFINKPITIESLSYQGEYNSMQPELEYIRKSLMSGSIPTFLTAFADDFNNRAISDDSLIGFFINLESDRELVIGFFNKLLCELWNIGNNDAMLYLDGAKSFESVHADKKDMDTNYNKEKTKDFSSKTIVKSAGNKVGEFNEPIPTNEPEAIPAEIPEL